MSSSFLRLSFLDYLHFLGLDDSRTLYDMVDVSIVTETSQEANWKGQTVYKLEAPINQSITGTDRQAGGQDHILKLPRY